MYLLIVCVKPNTEVFFGILLANPDELYVTHHAAMGTKQPLLVLVSTVNKS